MQMKQHLRQALISGVAYSLGLLFGNLAGIILSTVVVVPRAPSEFNTLLIGLLIAFLISALVGGIGGFAGGYTLPVSGDDTRRTGYAWPGAVSMALAYSGFLFVIMLLVTLFSLYDVADTPPQQFAVDFVLVGGLFGAINGVLLGLLTVGWRRTGYVVLASMIGFAVGGFALGLGGWNFLLSVAEGDLLSGQMWFLLSGILLFGLAGGSALGYAYSYLAGKPADQHGRLQIGKTKGAVLLIAAIALLLIGGWLLRPFFTLLNGVFTPRDAYLSPVLSSQTIGTHWFDVVSIDTAGDLSAPVSLAVRDSQLALVSIEESGGAAEITVRFGTGDPASQAVHWSEPRATYQGSARLTAPESAFTTAGDALHLAWRDGSTVFHARCAGELCQEPVVLPDAPFACAQGEIGDIPAAPALAVGADDRVMVVYHGADGALQYVSFMDGEPGDEAAARCIEAEGARGASQLSLAARPDGAFELAFAARRQVALLGYENGRWDDASTAAGAGELPYVFVDDRDQVSAAWCAADGGVAFWTDGAAEIVSPLPCLSRPEIAQDSAQDSAQVSDGRLHITWFADEVMNALGRVRQEPVIYEIIGNAGNWTASTIVSRVGGSAQPVQVGDNGILHLAWGDTAVPRAIHYTSQVQYGCPDAPQGRLAQVALDVARQSAYQPAGDPVPYCGNRYDRLLFTPGPPPESSLPQTQNGGFDGLAELIAHAEYEVLLSTMDYDEDENNDSPGSVIAEAVADLYTQLVADPQRYPRGLTVRILLGNPPPLETLELNSNLWYLLSDLRDAGVPEMVNEELGWRLEVANYEGAWPHSHAKILVIDGKTAVAAGFNMQYLHLDPEHPSGQGKGTVDLALQVSGPVAQDGQLAFDELWSGSTRRHCSDLFPDRLPWRFTCRDSRAVSDHVPEVLRYYLPGGDSTALSMLRTAVHDEADQQTVAALAAAEERIDLMHVQFSLPMICNLNYLLDVCDPRHAPAYINSILDAVEKNEAEVRILVDLKPFKGIENAIALGIMRDGVIDRGLADRVEVRSFASPVHAKGTLIDDEFVIVGSQNYHWSAFGENGGLAEYSLGTSDPAAVAEFQRFFEYHWGNTPPIPDTE